LLITRIQVAFCVFDHSGARFLAGRGLSHLQCLLIAVLAIVFVMFCRMSVIGSRRQHWKLSLPSVAVIQLTWQAHIDIRTRWCHWTTENDSDS